MYRYFILFCLIASRADAQSIITSGDRASIVVSGTGITISHPPGQSDPEIDRLRYENDFLKSSLKAATEKPAVVKTETIIVPVKKKQRQWYLVSESWCSKCPKAKQVFKSKGWPDSNILTITQCEQRFGFRVPYVPFEFGEPDGTKTTSTTVRSQSVSSQSRYYNYGGRTYDLETYGGCSMRSCGMCAEIRAAQQRYRASRRLINSIGPQAASPDDVMQEGLALMAGTLKPESVLYEPGCGDARFSILAVQQCIRKYGAPCRAIGVEIDEQKVAEARRSVADAGLSDWVTIRQGDVREFDPARHSVSHAYAYLDHFLLQEIAGKLQSVPIAVCPGHECLGIGMRLAGQCWVKGV